MLGGASQTVSKIRVNVTVHKKEHSPARRRPEHDFEEQLRGGAHRVVDVRTRRLALIAPELRPRDVADELKRAHAQRAELARAHPREE